MSKMNWLVSLLNLVSLWWCDHSPPFPARYLGLSLSLFFFFSTKSFIVSIWSEAWEIAPGWLESCQIAAGRTPNTRGPPQRQMDSRLLVLLGGWVFPRDAHQPSLGTSLGRSVTRLPSSWCISPAYLGIGAEPRACRPKSTWGSFFSMRMAAI